MTLLPVPLNTRPVVGLDDLRDEAANYAAQSRAASTIRAYQSDWRQFSQWCSRRGLCALPAEPLTLALYLTDSARTLKTSTLQRRLSSIAVAHQMAGETSPAADIVVRTTWSGIRRGKGTAQVGKDALLTENIRSMITALPDNLLGRRDACLLLLGFASAMRRSELVALDVGMINDMADGLVVTVGRSKTDQEGEGRLIGVPYGANPATCPVRAYRTWLAYSGIQDGPLFRPVSRHGTLGAARLSDHAVAGIVKRSALAAGLDPAAFAGHSLRSGMATSASRSGATEADIMRQTGHKSLPTLRRYIHRGSLFNDNAAGRLGL